jgi:hypothetical protein
MSPRRNTTRIALAGLAATAAAVLAIPSSAQAQPAPAPAAAAASITLSAVSCPEVTHCMAVGQAVSATDPGSDYAQVWNGKTWRAITVPTPGEPAGLNGVASTGPAAYIAVGSYVTKAGPGRPLAMAWNGKAWRILPVPGPADSELAAISCAGPKSCVAVGDSLSPGARKTLAEAWNGTAWRILPAASTGSIDSLLDGVSCTGPASCTAVGSTYSTAVPGGETLTLAEQWNGSRWVTYATASPGASLNVLASVSCARAARARTATCVAVGFWLNRGAAFAKPLADKWTGTRWQSQKPAVPARDRGASLLSVSCATTVGCMSVGGQIVAAPVPPLAESWNGTTWRLTTTASLGQAYGNLLALACPRASFCVAVGDQFTGASPTRALAEEWNGTRWRVM